MKLRWCSTRYTYVYSLVNANLMGVCRQCHARWSIYFSPMAQQPLVGQGLLIILSSRSHSDTPHSVEFLWSSDQPNAETSTWRNITLTRDSHPCLRRVWNPQSQQASGRIPMPYTARPPASDDGVITSESMGTIWRVPFCYSGWLKNTLDTYKRD